MWLEPEPSTGNSGALVVQTVAPANFDGTTEAPKTHYGNVTVDITTAAKLENAVIKGDLILTGKATENLTFSNIKVEGNIDVSGIEGSTINLTGIEVKGDTTL